MAGADKRSPSSAIQRVIIKKKKVNPDPKDDIASQSGSSQKTLKVPLSRNQIMKSN
jgi:hypothetical protein